MITKSDNRVKAYKRISNTNIPEKDGLPKLGVSNTKLKPVVFDQYSYSTEEVDNREQILVFVDWLKFWGEDLSMPKRHLDLIIDLFMVGSFWKTAETYHHDIEPMVVSEFEKSGQTRKGSRISWSKRWENSLGVKLSVAYRKDDPSLIDTIELEFSGAPLGALFPRNNFLKISEMMELMLSLNPKIKVTRIDTTLEFGHNLLDFKEILKAVNEGNYSGVKSATVIYEHKLGSGIQYPTVYLGSKSSNKRIRIYETEKKHGYKAIRIECQNRGKHAMFVVENIIRLYQQVAIECMNAKTKRMDAKIGIKEEYDRCNNAKLGGNKAIRDFIIDWVLSIKTFNFVWASSKQPWMTAIDYIELPFWSEFKTGLNDRKFVYKFAPIEVDIQKTMAWILNKVIGAYRVLDDYLGADITNHIFRYMSIINEKKYQGKYSQRNGEILKQLKALGNDVLFAMFGDNERRLLAKTGMYERMPKSFDFKSTFVNFNDFLRHPRNHEESLQF